MTIDRLPTEAEHRARLVLLDEHHDEPEDAAALDSVQWPAVDMLAVA